MDELLAGAQTEDPELRGLGAAIVAIRDTWGTSEIDASRASGVAADLATAATAAEHDSVRPAAAGRGRRKVAAAVAGGLAASVLLTGGLAAAEVLPDSAQRVVADLGDAVGVDLPEPASDKAVEAVEKRGDNGKGDSEAGEGGEGATHPDNHGAHVSDAAKDHSRDEECGNHGQAVSSVARGEDTCTPPGEGEGTEGESGTEPEKAPKADKAPKAGQPEDAPATQPETVPPVPPAPPGHSNADAEAPGAEPELPDPAQDRGRPEEG